MLFLFIGKFDYWNYYRFPLLQEFYCDDLTIYLLNQPIGESVMKSSMLGNALFLDFLGFTAYNNLIIEVVYLYAMRALEGGEYEWTR